MSALLEVENLSAQLFTDSGTIRPVDQVSFSINEGETFALLGESGCGKSMTALSIARLLPDAGEISSGAVRVAGRDVLPLPESQMRRVRGGDIGIIFQEPATSLNPVMTVGAQIVEVLHRHRGMHGSQAYREAEALLSLVGIPDPGRRIADYAFQFSGGMKQRAMVAMALAGQPRLLIADEPTTALDVTIQAQVLDLLKRIQSERRMGMLLITHDLGVVSQLAHHVGVMYAGHLVETAPRDAFFDHPAHPYSKKLFAALPREQARGRPLATIPGTVPTLSGEMKGCRFADRCADAWERCREEAPQWHSVASTHAVRCHLFAPNVDRASAASMQPSTVVPSDTEVNATTETLLSVQGLQVHFPIRKGIFKRITGAVRAVDGVDLSIPAGRTVALVGESGCGKTTAGKAILQLIRPTAGSVQFGGRELTSMPGEALRSLRRDMQIVFQDPFSSLNPRMRVGEIVAEGIRALTVEKDAASTAERVRQILQTVGLAPDAAQRYPHEFSGGQRQRVAIARALAVNPRLLICDEPTSALDVSVQAQIVNLMRDIQQRLGLSYLFITHNIALVEYLAHEVAIMYLGRIVECGPAKDVLAAPRHPYTQALLSAVPRIGQQTVDRVSLPGDLPSPVNPPKGCHFHPRCPQAMEICRQAYPKQTQLASTHVVRCYLYSK